MLASGLRDRKSGLGGVGANAFSDLRVELSAQSSDLQAQWRLKSGHRSQIAAPAHGDIADTISHLIFFNRTFALDDDVSRETAGAHLHRLPVLRSGVIGLSGESARAQNRQAAERDKSGDTHLEGPSTIILCTVRLGREL